MNPQEVILGAVVGPTASGKSALATEIARRVPRTEIVSVDSMAVYRHMDIGTAKPSAADRAEIPHHLVDLADPHEEFTVAEFQAACGEALADIAARGARALLVGGTGLYLRSVIDELTIPGRYPEIAEHLAAEPDTSVLHARLAEADPVAASRMEPNNRRRVLRALEVTLGSGRPFSSYGPGLDSYRELPYSIVGLELPRDVLDERIGARFAAQLDAGLLDEVAALAAWPHGLSRTAAQALGYKELLAHLRGEVSYDEAVAEAVTRTRRFARRQQRWFRRDPRIVWLSAPEDGAGAAGDALSVLGT